MLIAAFFNSVFKISGSFVEESVLSCTSHNSDVDTVKETR